MTVTELLIDRQITSALIIDDAYDRQPLAKDLAGNEEAWNTFIADIQPQLEIVTGIFPQYMEMTSDQLRTSDAFVTAMWGAKEQIGTEIWDTLFDDYSRATAGDRMFLLALEEKLGALGITCVPSGRQSPAPQNRPPLIFADLFLGATQDAYDVDESVRKLRSLLKGREDNPPVVILMSRSPRLQDRTADFRDKAGLLGALFRVSSKEGLIADSNLEKLLRRMAQHRPDALRVARFLKSWEDGLDEAKKQFMISIRRLDLSDYVQVREVLLNFEGQPLGSYLLDVFDRVLQFEIEGNAQTIIAAEDLNKIDPDSYAVPYIAESADLQHLVYRTIVQNPERLKVRATDCEAPVGFGDILFRMDEAKPNASPEDAGSSRVGICAAVGMVQSEMPKILLVLTPACDLVREGGASRVLLLAGVPSPLDSRSWNYKDVAAPKTPILEIQNGNRIGIKWNMKDLRMLSPGEISTLLSEHGQYQVVARLRESNALEIQQKVLSSMGRIGLLAPMPATFEVDVRAWYFGADGMNHDLDVPILVREGGVCFVGRDKEGNENTRLVLTEQATDDLMAAIGSIGREAVATAAQRAFDALKASKVFETEVQRGLSVPAPRSAFRPIQCLKDNARDEKDTEIVGAIARNPIETTTPSAAHRSLVIVVSDRVPIPVG